MISDLDLFISRGRRFNIRFAWLEQVPGELCNAVTSSALLKVAFNTQAGQVFDTRKLMGLNPDQADVLRELAVGQAIVVLGGKRCPDPMVIETQQYHTDVTSLSQREILELCRRSMAELEKDVTPRYLAYEESVRAGQKLAKDPNALTKRECLLLGALARGPNTIAGACEETGLDGQQESTARAALMKKGLVQHAGSFGNKRKLHAITEKGADRARELGYSVSRYKSGAVHEVVLGLAEKGLGVAIRGSAFQRRHTVLNGVQPDSLMAFGGNEGRRAAIQIVCSKNYPREAWNVARLHEVNDLDLIILVSASRTIQIGLDKALAKQFGGQVSERVISVNIEQTLQPTWDWKAKLGLASSQ